MKTVFFGSGPFAVKILEHLLASRHEIPLVVTQPDRKKGRHLHLQATPVKNYACTHGLEIYQPVDVNAPGAIDTLKRTAADIFLVVSYGNILTPEVLLVPRLISVNIHASLLPKYRGAAPVRRALMDGAKRTGVTFIRMNRRMDRGDILHQRALNVDPSDTAVSLDEKLKNLAGEDVFKVLGLIETGRVRFKKQTEHFATYAPALKKEEGLIRWEESATQVYNRFRGCFGWPGTFTYYHGKILKILKMTTGKKRHRARPGEIVAAGRSILEAACGQGTVLIDEVLPESHKKMPVASFLAGHKVRTGDFFGK